MSPSPDALVSQLVGALRGVLARVAEPDAVLATLLEQAVALTEARRGVLVEVNPRGELGYSVLHAYRADQLRDAGHFSHNIFAMCLRTGEDVLMLNACTDLPADMRSTANRLHLASVLCMPVRCGDRITALVHLEHPHLGHFVQAHATALRPLLDLAGEVLEASRAGREVLREHDDLAEEARRDRDLLAHDWSFGRFVGRTDVVRELERRIRSAATSPYPALLLGETGTGKSMLARILHFAGPRAREPFVTVFCPSLERSLMEAELFGHRRGAFTDAVADRVGKVEKAHGGTLFLDEIGELPMELQPKLLRMLQERTYERLGDAEERPVDVRVIAATSVDLPQEVRAGRFRRDLFERLNFVPVRVPPLRERREDIPAILRHCLDRTEAGRWIELTDDAQRWLRELDFAWPGNVRHLEQLAVRLTLAPPRGPAEIADLARLLDHESASACEGAGPGDAAAVAAAVPRSPEPGAPPPDSLPRALAEAERAWLEASLRRHPDLTRAELAAKLEISESALYKKLRAYSLA